MLLLWGRFAVSPTIIPEAKEHFLTPSAPRDTHLFGGLGVRYPHRKRTKQVMTLNESSACIAGIVGAVIKLAHL